MTVDATSPRASRDRVRVAVALPGLHRVLRGAEVAFESLAAELARDGRHDVTLIGSGEARAAAPYRFVHVDCVPRERFERWPTFPAFRSECSYEELTFLPGLWRKFRPRDYDILLTCSYPFVNWALRARSVRSPPVHVFVTQNGDWPLYRKNSEFRLFGCDGVVCTNPDYYDAHAKTWKARLIPNGADFSVFSVGPGDRARFGLPERAPVVLIVSALISTKRVIEGIRAVAPLPDVHLVVAGAGPLRQEVDGVGAEAMGARFRRLELPRSEMPALYRSANAFLHMSVEEPSANAYIEALASGLTVVTHDRRVTRWTLGSGAHFVDALDLPAVTEAVKTALAHPVDRGLVAAEARSRFDWSKIAKDYSVFFDELLEARGVRASA